MRGEPFTENFRLFLLARPTRAILARQRQNHRLMLTGAVAESLKIVVKTIYLLHTFACRFHSLEAEHVAEEARVDVLLAGRRRVKIEVTCDQSCALQDLCDVRGTRRDAAHDLRDVCRATLVKLYDLLFLGARLVGHRGGFARTLCRWPNHGLFGILKLQSQRLHLLDYFFCHHFLVPPGQRVSCEQFYYFRETAHLSLSLSSRGASGPLPCADP